VLLEAAGLALIASLSPTALLAGAVYLGSSRPKVIAAYYLAGAVLISILMGIVLLVALRAANLSRPGEETPRYDLRLGIGILLLIAGIVLSRRKPRPVAPDGSPQGFLGRMVADPAPRSAFLVGVLIFSPGVTFLAAVQVIATSRASVELTVAAVVVVVVLYVLLVWLPIVLYLVFPDVTTRHLTAFNGWLIAHGRAVVVGALFVVGAFMVGNGIYGLVAVG
jgi:Sap, sulfolipid-1-addressing protein